MLFRVFIIIPYSYNQIVRFICGCSTMASTPAFQAGHVGSIPITRFSLDKKRKCVPVAQLDRATAF